MKSTCTVIQSGWLDSHSVSDFACFPVPEGSICGKPTKVLFKHPALPKVHPRCTDHAIQDQPAFDYAGWIRVDL